MLPFENESEIKAPIDHVFEFVPTPSNWNDLFSTLWEINDVEDMTAGSHRFRYTILLIGSQAERNEFGLTTITEW